MSTVSMQVARLEERPPYVQFERMQEEDRTATIAAGRYQARDVDYAVITPAGSKDRIYREVSSWWTYLEQQVAEQRYSAIWLDHYRKSYEAWKSGQELPVHGTPVKTWGAVSPAQVKMLINADVRTVEDLAQANEQSLIRIGMGGRSLKETAQRWLAESGKNLDDLKEAQALISDQRSMMDELRAQLKLVKEQVASMATASEAPPPAPSNPAMELRTDAFLANPEVIVSRKIPRIGGKSE